MELTTTAHQVTGAVLIPSDAMFFESGVSYVYVVQDGKAVRSDVTIGLYTADTIAVTSGLTLGDEVITTCPPACGTGSPCRPPPRRRTARAPRPIRRHPAQRRRDNAA